MKTALTIAGFDPSSGAGVTADLMVFAAHGLFGTSCITALTVQSTVGVLSTHPVSSQIVADTLNCLDADLPPSGIKIGLLGDKANISIISRYVAFVKAKLAVSGDVSKTPIVLDPVVRSSSGRELLDVPAIAALRQQLLPLVDWITPNMDELALLSDRPSMTRDEILIACRALQQQLAPRAKSGALVGIVATGGHLDPPDDFLLTPNGEGIWLPGERVLTQSTHGTGCAFSSAFLSRLVLGDEPTAAALAAKVYVAGALKNSKPIGLGLGPMNHLWNLLNPIHSPLGRFSANSKLKPAGNGNASGQG